MAPFFKLTSLFLILFLHTVIILPYDILGGHVIYGEVVSP